MKRRKLSSQQSRRNFRQGTGVKAPNMRGNPMRGGIRL